MLIDITITITSSMLEKAKNEKNRALMGHIGTHFDVMDKEFPVEYTKRDGIVFDVSAVKNRDICSHDIDIDAVESDMFVAFYTGFIERVGYGEDGYFTAHPQLSDELIDKLVGKKISIIGLDFAGIRRGSEHIPKDGFCAEHGVFVVENLCNLSELAGSGRFVAHTYPMKLENVTGLPCRVIAQTCD